MSNVSKDELDRAVQEYLAAIDKLKGLRDKYFPAGRVTPGKPAVFEELVTEEALAELKEAATDVAEKWEKCMGLSRRRVSSDAEG